MHHKGQHVWQIRTAKILMQGSKKIFQTNLISKSDNFHWDNDGTIQTSNYWETWVRITKSTSFNCNIWKFRSSGFRFRRKEQNNFFHCSNSPASEGFSLRLSTNKSIRWLWRTLNMNIEKMSKIKAVIWPFRTTWIKTKGTKPSIFQSNNHLPLNKCQLTIDERNLIRIYGKLWVSTMKLGKNGKKFTFIWLLGLVRKKVFFEHFLHWNDCGLRVWWKKVSK